MSVSGTPEGRTARFPPESRPKNAGRISVQDGTPERPDKGYDAGPFLPELERRWIKPHVAIKSGRIDPLSGRADEGTWSRWFVRSEQRRAAFKKSQRRRKLMEEFFGRVKAVAGMRRARHVG